MKCKLTKERCPFPKTFWEGGMAGDAANDNCPIGKYKGSDHWAVDTTRDGTETHPKVIVVLDDTCRYYGVTRRFEDNYIRD